MINICIQCRPPGIYKAGYLKELWERFGGGAEDAPNAPELPEWCYEEEEGSDNDDDGDGTGIRGYRDGKRAFDEDERPAKRRRKEHHVKVFLLFLFHVHVFVFIAIESYVSGVAQPRDFNGFQAIIDRRF